MAEEIEETATIPAEDTEKTPEKGSEKGPEKGPERDPDKEPEKDDGFVLDRKAVAAILYTLDIEDRDTLVALMEPMHAADIADLLEQINAYDRGRLIRLYGQEMDGEILSELDETLREEVIAAMSPQVLAEAVRELDSDDVVYLI
jgi:magnesium transporter